MLRPVTPFSIWFYTKSDGLCINRGSFTQDLILFEALDMFSSFLSFVSLCFAKLSDLLFSLPCLRNTVRSTVVLGRCCCAVRCGCGMSEQLKEIPPPHHMTNACCVHVGICFCLVNVHACATTLSLIVGRGGWLCNEQHNQQERKLQRRRRLLLSTTTGTNLNHMTTHERAILAFSLARCACVPLLLRGSGALKKK